MGARTAASKSVQAWSAALAKSCQAVSPSLDLELAGDDELLVGVLLDQGRTEGAPPGLLRQLVGIVAGVRSEDRPALPPERRARAADAGPAGALLPPGLLAAAADERPGLGRRVALALIGPIVDDGLVDQVVVRGLGEDALRQVHLGGRLAASVDDVEFRHGALFSVHLAGAAFLMRT
jgi:hypothetical protein